MKNHRLLTIFFIVFVDMLGFSLILPLLPYYAESFGANATIVGLLVASYAAAQLIGAPILGRLSDRYGRRPILLFSVAGTLFGFLLLGFAEQAGQTLARFFALQSTSGMVIAILFFSRILDGLTGGNISVAQAYIADISDEQNRAKSLGIVGAAFGLGFIIGPATGGLLSQWGYNLPALAAAGVSLANLVLIYFTLPESLVGEIREKAANHRRPGFTFSALAQALQRPGVGPLLHIRFFYGLAFAMFQTVFSLYAQTIGLSSQVTGYVLAYVGLLSVITQVAMIGPLTQRFRENVLIITGLWLMAFALLAWSFTDSLVPLLIVMLPMALSGGVLNTVLQSTISKAVSREEVGGILGISSSLEAITRVIAPSAGGFLLQRLGVWSPGVFSALVMAWVVIFAYRRVIIPGRRERLASS